MRHASIGRLAGPLVIVIDTNVVSEMMRDQPHPKVLAWSGTVGRLHTTAVTLAEIDYGIARLAVGARRERLAEIARVLFADFDEMILAFDARAARRYGEIVAGREKSGRPISTADAQIAAICASRNATLATRNTATSRAPASASSTPGPDDRRGPTRGGVRKPGCRSRRAPRCDGWSVADRGPRWCPNPCGPGRDPRAAR